MRYESPSIERRETVQGLMTFNQSGGYDFCAKFPAHPYCNTPN